MVSAGVPPGLETLRDYALPVYLTAAEGGGARLTAERVVQHLKEAGLTAAAAADALTARLLAAGHWHQAAAVCKCVCGEEYDVFNLCCILSDSALLEMYFHSIF